jgi:hypothetical protein
MAPKRSGASVGPKPRDIINPEMAAVRGDPLSTTNNITSSIGTNLCKYLEGKVKPIIANPNSNIWRQSINNRAGVANPPFNFNCFSVRLFFSARTI